MNFVTSFLLARNFSEQLNYCLSTLSRRSSAFTRAALSTAGKTLVSQLSPGHLVIKMLVQDTESEFPFLGLTFRKSDCWMSNNPAGSTSRAPEEQMAGAGPGMPALRRCSSPGFHFPSSVRADSFSKYDGIGIRLNRNVTKSISFQGSTPNAA